MNNNLDLNISLVNEFTSIWRDLQRFTISSNENDPEPDDEMPPQLSKITDRVDKRIKSFDERESEEDLFADYIGSYTVKKKNVRRSRNSCKAMKRTNKRPAKKRRRMEEIKGLAEEINVNVEISPEPTLELDPTLPLHLPHNLNCEVMEDEASTVDETEDQSTRHTRLLKDFLEKNNFFATIIEDQEVSDDALSQAEEEMIVEDETIDGEEIPRVESSEEASDLLVDVNNNQVATIIDISSSSTDTDNTIEVSDVSDAESQEEHCDIRPMEKYKHPLQYSWSFWYLSPNEEMSWSMRLQKLASVSTIEDFWSVYNWVDAPSEMKCGADFSLFKEGILPDWSDLANARGGRYIVKCSKEETDDMWKEILMALVGHTFGDGELFETVTQHCAQLTIPFNISMFDRR